MIRATIGIFSQGGVAIDADYQAVLDYATTQTYTLPSASQQTLQNQLVVDLKDAGVWSKLDVFYVFATDGDSDFASINWKDPNNFECTEVNSPTFTTNEGFNGNSSSAYLNTNLSFPTDLSLGSQNDFHATCYTNTLNNSGGTIDDSALMGSYGGGANIIMGFRNSDYSTWCWSGVNDIVPIDANYFAIDRSVSSTYDSYQDSSVTVSIDNSSAITTPYDMYVLARNGSGTPTWQANSSITMRSFSLGSSIDGLHDEYKTALDNYYNAL